MSEDLTEEEALAAVRRLTRARLAALVAAGAVRPDPGAAGGPVYSRLDLVRLELACDLAEGWDLDAEATGLVLTLVERLHETRAELQAVLRALEREPEAVRARVRARLTILSA
jgi:chaperone modulatory protein CbpM